eukprot:TRINITY_DN3020_c0_g1_i1.p1 TRINITY_DN3020_c0_g1~~TRINITY_DN3020_c0_g1_i1.p1  ORF type:complete len:662 (-),score=232.27 TRINITY_DN3020_c0_g1_i1:857-2842(-)
MRWFLSRSAMGLYSPEAVSDFVAGVVDQYAYGRNLLGEVGTTHGTETLTTYSYAKRKIRKSKYGASNYHPNPPKVKLLRDDKDAPKILPVEGKRNVLITSALPYVNNVPHLGNIIGCVLSADVYARYCRLRGYNTLYVCGTDEYGTATETRALKEGVTPRELCDKYSAIHDQIYRWFDIDFDYFGRTTTDKQTEIAQDIFLKVKENEYLIRDTVKQLYCEKCQTFLADRFVEGTCPHCKYEDARGDQCDKCGKLLNPIELIEPRCKTDGTSPIVKVSEHLFLDLPKLEPQLTEWIEQSRPGWTDNAVGINKSWLKMGLEKRCITRDLKWGTPVPMDDFRDKVFYVWFDAPIGYLSITANYTEDWEQWWKNPEHVELAQFMGKDNVPFHTVIFPSSLIATKPQDNYTMLNRLSTTEYLTYENDKFSKSRNLGVFGNHAAETGVPASVWRYVLLSNRPEHSDSNFSWSDFFAKNNHELLAKLGNFVYRALKLTHSSFGGKVPEGGVQLFGDMEKELVAAIDARITQYIADMEDMKIRSSIGLVMEISHLGNTYLQDKQPWVLVKQEDEESKQQGCNAMWLVLNIAKTICPLLEPYMPGTVEEILESLNIEHPIIPDSLYLDLPSGHTVNQGYQLFKKLEDDFVEKMQARYGGGDSSSSSSSSK